MIIESPGTGFAKYPTRQEGNTVTLFYRKDKFFRIKKRNEERIQEFISSKKIKVLFNSTLEEISEKYILINDG